MSTTSPAAQRTISVSIFGIDGTADAMYSYWSPVTGEHHADVPVCDLLVNRPINSLFILDYQSTLNGWTITGTRPNGKSRPLPFTLGPNNFSVSTFNDYEFSGEVFRFYIEYQNVVTGAVISIDPQEGNVPRVD